MKLETFLSAPRPCIMSSSLKRKLSSIDLLLLSMIVTPMLRRSMSASLRGIALSPPANNEHPSRIKSIMSEPVDPPFTLLFPLPEPKRLPKKSKMPLPPPFTLPFALSPRPSCERQITRSAPSSFKPSACCSAQVYQSLHFERSQLDDPPA